MCGDQSSGKSSVLQAIAGIPFPHSSDQCTRFATEVILKRSSFVGVTVSIKSYNTKETTVFKTKRDLTSVDDLSEVIRKAGDKMERTGAFSKDILQIEISDPTKKPLILVDLPGLIHNGPDEAVVVGMVEDYMKNTRTVILAVVTAGGDPDPQAVLKLAKIHDPEGRRTFGIITKPDKSDGNTNLQKRLIGMAKNLDKNFKFDLGWHVLMNGAANDGEQQLDLEKRAKEEKRFFEAGPWSGVPKGNCCIGPLRQRLSTMLLDHVKQELKGIKGDISAAIARCQKERADMGELHQDLPSKRNFLVETGKKYHKICNQAITGLYTTSRFFGTGFSSNPEDDALYLRGRIKNLNVAFAYTFWKYGHHKEIEDCSLIPQGLIDTDESTDHFDDCRVEPDEITRKYAVVDWVKPVAKKSRGVEIVDGRNPTLVKFLFCEQSQKWETLAYRHLDECSAACRKFLRLVLEAVVPEAREEIRDSLHDWIDRKLERRVADAKREMASIIADCRDCFPIVNNYQYYDEVGIARVKRAGNGSARQTITSLRHTLGSVVGLPTQAELVSGLTEVIGSLDGDAEEVHEDPEDQRCEASLDEMLAYYKVGHHPSVSRGIPLISSLDRKQTLRG